MRLTVLYDAECPLCVRCKSWMQRQPALVELEFLASQSAAARARYGAVRWMGEELVVVSDGGDVWIGASAFIMCLWALYDWREWSVRLSGTTFAPLAEGFFKFISGRRQWIGSFLRGRQCDAGVCDHRADASRQAPRSPYR